MKILAVGDLVGGIGLNKLKEVLPNLIEAEHIDFVIVNAENVAGRNGNNNKRFGARRIFFLLLIIQNY